MVSPCISKVRIKEQPFKHKKKGLSAKRKRRVGDEDEAEEEKQREEKRAGGDSSGEEAEMEAEPAEDPLASLTQQQLTEALVEMLLPGETVAAGLRRLGGLAGRKKGKLRGANGGGEEPVVQRDAEKLDRLTALADRLVASGMFEIYQQTCEKLAYLLKSQKLSSKKLKGGGGEEDDDEEADELDMFGDKFDESHGGKGQEGGEDGEEAGSRHFFDLQTILIDTHLLMYFLDL